MEALFEAHWPRAHRAAYLVVHDAALAEDIAQESFLAAIRLLTASTGAGRSGRGSTGSS
jgi:DNA-directed RNA polymerase specialized sigma24 family protein